MSLFSTITHGEAPALRGISPRRIGMAGLVLVAGMALGYAISNIDLADEPEATPAAQAMSHGEFLELNTTALWWEPIVPGQTLSRSKAKVDPFIKANVGSYTALNEPWQVAAEFTRVNTELPVYGPYDQAEAARFDRFVAINTSAYEALNQAWHVDSGFLELNTNLGTIYTEPTSGPR